MISQYDKKSNFRVIEHDIIIKSPKQKILLLDMIDIKEKDMITKLQKIQKLKSCVNVDRAENVEANTSKKS